MKKFKYGLMIFILTGFTICHAEHAISVQNQLAQLESISGGRIGISAINTGNNQQIQYRVNESFPMQCTDKVIGVAAILKKNIQDNKLLQKRIYYKKNDLSDWSPITKKHLTDGMTVAQLCAAAISYSDNTAMNLLARMLGGPAGVNKFARSIGDTHFKLDHWWPEEALSSPESKEDSSTPLAMNESLRKLVEGNVLAKPEQEMLVTWLKENTTGGHRIRAGVPQNWIVGDKTGTGSYGATNDIAVIWPPKCAPIFITIFYSTNKKNAPHREDVLASATRILIHFYEKA